MEEETAPPSKLTISMTSGNGEEIVSSKNIEPSDKASGTKIIAPAPRGIVVCGEDEKKTAKHRLQRLIREFAHDVVAAGLSIDAECTEFAIDENNTIKAALRMDKRLSQIELWRAAASPGSSGEAASAAVLIAPLQKVESIMKGVNSENGAEVAANGKAGMALTILRTGKPQLCVTFDSEATRDRTYTCLRIFQMSVDQSESGAQSPRDG